LAWFVVNVLAPVFLPLLLLGLAKSAPAGRHLRLMETVKDGQLCWFGITLSAATFYELMQNDQSPHRASWCAVGMALMAMTGVLCGVHAVVAAIKPTPILDEAAVSRRAWMEHYAVFMTSAILSLLVALASLLIHIVLR